MYISYNILLLYYYLIINVMYVLEVSWHPSSISNWTPTVNAEPGFFKEVFEALHYFPSEDKDCNLVLDGMACQSENKLIGIQKKKNLLGIVILEMIYSYKM